MVVVVKGFQVWPVYTSICQSEGHCAASISIEPGLFFPWFGSALAHNMALRQQAVACVQQVAAGSWGSHFGALRQQQLSGMNGMLWAHSQHQDDGAMNQDDGTNILPATCCTWLIRTRLCCSKFNLSCSWQCSAGDQEIKQGLSQVRTRNLLCDRVGVELEALAPTRETLCVVVPSHVGTRLCHGGTAVPSWRGTWGTYCWPSGGDGKPLTLGPALLL
jgi:hypothetical protein